MCGGPFYITLLAKMAVLYTCPAGSWQPDSGGRDDDVEK